MPGIESLFQKHANKHVSDAQASSSVVAASKQVDRDQIAAEIKQLVESNQVIVFSKSYCPYCRQAKMALRSVPNFSFKTIELDDGEHDGWQAQIAKLAKSTAVSEAANNNTMSVPQIFVKQQYVGGADDLSEMFVDNRLANMLGRKLY